MARRSFQRALLGLLLVSSGTGSVLAMRPPELIRGAIEHEHFERTLRGTFMDGAPLLQHLELEKKPRVPRFPKLMRPCDIDGHLVYHLTTFLEKGSIVTMFAFDQAVALKGRQRLVGQRLLAGHHLTRRQATGAGGAEEAGAGRGAKAVSGRGAGRGRGRNGCGGGGAAAGAVGGRG